MRSRKIAVIISLLIIITALYSRLLFLPENDMPIATTNDQVEVKQ